MLNYYIYPDLFLDSFLDGYTLAYMITIPAKSHSLTTLGLRLCIHWWNIYIREEGPWKKHTETLKVDLGNSCVQGILGSGE